MEALEVPRGSLEDRLNYRCRKRRIALLPGLREEQIREVKGQERVVATHDVRHWVGKMQPTEASIEHAVVGSLVSPAAQSANGVRVLPERRFIEIGSIYVEMRRLNATKTKVDYQWSNSSMALPPHSRTFS